MMNKEYMYYHQDELDFPLDESIEVLTALGEDEYLISNTKDANAHVYAPEIDFYVKNSRDSIAGKIQNIKKLYDIRATNIDYAQDFDFSQEVGKNVLIVSDENQDELQAALKAKDFTSIVLNPINIVDVYGHIGALHVSIRKEEEVLGVDTDQIIWFDAPLMATKQSGTVDPNEIGLDEAIKQVTSIDGVYHYKNFIKYNENICQYHERKLEETCGKCVEVCPRVAIMKVDEERHLEFSHIDCHGCGGCISVCPSGALDYSQMPRIAFNEISGFYKGHTPLIVPAKMDIESLHVSLKEGILPLAIEGEKFLHEAHLLTLLQKSGNQIIFYTDFISKGTGDVIRMLNEIFEKRYGKKAIYVCETPKELEEVSSKLEPLKECMYDFNEEGMAKREIFSARLAHLVGDKDWGIVETGEHVHYGDITVNEDNCTLCLSCVGACNVRALTAHAEDNTLRFNPSICTNCGYCEVSCPEKDCLHVVKDTLYLAPSYFTQKVMAKDDLQACVECGKEFATVKSVERVASIMKPIFAGDDIKIRSLYCCADCKPKLVLQNDYDMKMRG